MSAERYEINCKTISIFKTTARPEWPAAFWEWSLFDKDLGYFGNLLTQNFYRKNSGPIGISVQNKRGHDFDPNQCAPYGRLWLCIVLAFWGCPDLPLGAFLPQRNCASIALYEADAIFSRIGGDTLCRHTPPLLRPLLLLISLCTFDCTYLDVRFTGIAGATSQEFGHRNLVI